MVCAHVLGMRPKAYGVPLERFVSHPERLAAVVDDDVEFSLVKQSEAKRGELKHSASRAFEVPFSWK